MDIGFKGENERSKMESSIILNFSNFVIEDALEDINRLVQLVHHIAEQIKLQVLKYIFLHRLIGQVELKQKITVIPEAYFQQF